MKKAANYVIGIDPGDRRSYWTKSIIHPDGRIELIDAGWVDNTVEEPGSRAAAFVAWLDRFEPGISFVFGIIAAYAVFVIGLSVLISKAAAWGTRLIFR